ncbi:MULTISPECIES: hypothetical protein [unclassified Nocardia]|uniref:hypothetical protein n=1 Tax=unclassified Nocardia TaxID=2637762 RepID=UPI0024A8630B|nr:MULTISPECIES: hypothetical protein [unclassified Nocardia]
MSLRFLGKGGSTNNGCPALLVDDQRRYVIQAWKTDRADTVELPHLLLGFLEPDTFIGGTLTDTGRGTFILTGQPITDHETLSQLDLADDETAISVPKRERTFYGAASAR